MMEYRSFADLANTIFLNGHLVPADTDMVVGIPRSGILPATLLALQLNLPFQELGAWLADCPVKVGRTATVTIANDRPPQKILIVDDSIASGKSAREARALIQEKRPGLDTVFLAVYGSTSHSPDVDIILEVVEMPRIFQWNLMRHARLSDACFDIDGVLCHDPDAAQNDDGTNYTHFLLNATPLLKTRTRIKHLVTSRLEKYRPQTEQWLRENRIDYEKLWMLDLPSAEERRKQNAHGSFKAQVYTQTNACIFVESESRQAQQIADLSQKPVLSIADQAILWPTGSGRRVKVRHRVRQSITSKKGMVALARSYARAMIGSRNIALIRRALQKS